MAGGFTQGATPSSYFIPYESQRLDKGWRVSGIHFGAAPTSLTSVALCG